MFENLLGGMLGGSGGKGGSMIMNMLLPMITKPETMNMLMNKGKEMFVHLAERFECEVKDLSISCQLVTVQKTSAGTEPGTQIVELDGEGKAVMQDRFLILFFVDKDGKRTAVQKAWADEYIADIIQQLKNEKQ